MMKLIDLAVLRSSMNVNLKDWLKYFDGFALSLDGLRGGDDECS